jgi:hypothetical protein
MKRKDLELMESLLIYFKQPSLNANKLKNPPMPVVVINRWYTTDDIIRQRYFGAAMEIDDVVFWDSELWHLGQRLTLFTD